MADELQKLLTEKPLVSGNQSIAGALSIILALAMFQVVVLVFALYSITSKAGFSGRRLGMQATGYDPMSARAALYKDGGGTAQAAKYGFLSSYESPIIQSYELEELTRDVANSVDPRLAGLTAAQKALLTQVHPDTKEPLYSLAPHWVYNSGSAAMPSKSDSVAYSVVSQSQYRSAYKQYVDESLTRLKVLYPPDVAETAAMGFGSISDMPQGFGLSTDLYQLSY
jgi:hypothetical protein